MAQEFYDYKTMQDSCASLLRRYPITATNYVKQM